MPDRRAAAVFWTAVLVGPLMQVDVEDGAGSSTSPGRQRFLAAPATSACGRAVKHSRDLAVATTDIALGA